MRTYGTRKVPPPLLYALENREERSLIGGLRGQWRPQQISPRRGSARCCRGPPPGPARSGRSRTGCPMTPASDLLRKGNLYWSVFSGTCCHPLLPLLPMIVVMITSNYFLTISNMFCTSFNTGCCGNTIHTSVFGPLRRRRLCPFCFCENEDRLLSKNSFSQEKRTS